MPHAGGGHAPMQPAAILQVERMLLGIVRQQLARAGLSHA